MFGLGHVRVHVLEIAQLGTGPVAGIGVEGIQSFVNFHCHEDVVFFGGGNECFVVFEGLDDGFGDHDVHSLLDAGEGDVVVGVVGCEYDGDVAFLEGGDGVGVGGGVDGVVGGEGVACQIHVLVDISNVLLHVGAYSGEFFALDCGVG